VGEVKMPSLTLGLIERAVIVAVVAVRMVQVAVDEIVDVVPVRHRLVPASRPVDVPCLVPLAAVLGGAAVGVLLRHLDCMLVDVIGVRVMQVTVVQIVDVVAVTNRRVSARGAMLVRVVGVVGLRTRRHERLLSIRNAKLPEVQH
jgi:hypothetical protein